MNRQYGRRFRMGKNCIIEEDVIIGDRVELGHNVTLKNGTIIADNVKMADYCCTTGLCYIGNNVNIRTRSTVSKGVIIGDCAFLGAGVMTSHTKNIHHCRPDIPRKQLITRIGFGAVIGSHSNLNAGVAVGNNVVVGYSSFVAKDLPSPGIYFGHPAKKMFELDPRLELEIPVGWKLYEFSEDLLKKYLSYAI